MKKFVLLSLTIALTIISFAQDSTFYFTTSDSTRLFVRIAGQGKPCVFVHGGPGSTSYYYEVMPGAQMIEEKMKMVYFDQRGSGRSGSAKDGDYSLARMLKDIEELRTALHYQKWAVMGHSFAGILVTNYAQQYPQSITSLMLINCTLNMPLSMMSHINNGLKILDLKDQAVYRDTAKPLMERVGMVHQKLTEQNLWYKLMFRNAYEKKYSDSVTLSIKDFNWEFGNKVWGVQDYFKDFTPLTSRIKCPVLVMTGDHDFAIGPEHYQSFHFPKQTVVHYIGGHAPFQEEPQWFAEKIIEFSGKL
ncbi:alpha/beta hydrolase [Chitinophagaceae bacterium LB-8]|uniref:Alpha/beta hydrolase n=1 Tax=Paraflavisolibacter caeni TaxID=2982496 RepID=A0A9X2XZP4_9BACT|nr:alpha/beta hydrolase [Paraflavisolibacter caeni]MCU7551657.1 alpha/beta hydrolase [Paraflavisolibacter caeni]